MFKRFRIRLIRLAFLCKVDMILEDHGGVFTNEWTRSVHLRFWTSGSFIRNLAWNMAVNKPARWGAAQALVGIKMMEER